MIIQIDYGIGFAICQGVGGNGQTMQPSLNSRTAVTHLPGAIQTRVVRINDELGRPGVSRYSCRYLTAHMMLPASSFNTVQLRSAVRVTRLMKTIGRTQPSRCRCCEETLNPSMLASEQNRRGRLLSYTASQPGNSSTGCEDSFPGNPLTRTAMSLVQENLIPCLRKCIQRSYFGREVHQKLTIVAETTEKTPKLLYIGRIRRLGERG